MQWTLTDNWLEPWPNHAGVKACNKPAHTPHTLDHHGPRESAGILVFVFKGVWRRDKNQSQKSLESSLLCEMPQNWRTWDLEVLGGQRG